MKNFLFLISVMFTVQASAAQGGFLFTTFRDETTPMSEQIYLAVSENGKQWESLNGGDPVLVSDVGTKGVRDSFALRSHDGQKVWIIATDLCVNRNRDWGRHTRAGSRSIVVWESTDLVHWSPPRLEQVAPEEAGCVWAPEAIYDEDAGDYLVYWASTTKSDNYAKQRIWAAHTRDFRTFDKPFVFLEKPNHVIDIDIVRDGDTYYRFTKDDKDKSVSMASSKKLAGPWEEMPQFTYGKGKNFEGPICYQLKLAADGQPPEWCLLLDNVSDRIGPGAFGHMPFISHDLNTGEFTPAKDFHFPYPFRHGSVLPITTAELGRLESAYPKPHRLIDYFRPIPVKGKLSADAWGTPDVGPRDPDNGEIMLSNQINGIDHWTLRGLAYDPTRDFIRYVDGTVNHWNKIERPGVILKDGHVTHFTFAVIDVPKEQEKGNDRHGSKVIVVPFDGEALDRDLAEIVKREGDVAPAR